MSLPSRVTVVEVGPRDGLQNEAISLSIDDRVTFCNDLIAAGLPVVEVGAFVSPAWVPQMAGSGEVLRRLATRADVRLPVLVPNRKGFDLAHAAGAREIAVFTAASETFNRRNTNATIAESFGRFEGFVPEAKHEGLRVRGYVSTCFGCPYEGVIPVERAVEVVTRLAELGCDEVSIGDTIGVAVPTQVSEVAGRLREAVPVERLAVHFHDTRGTALANVLAALQEGITVVDSAAGGLGGCPYAPGASGNLATEDLVYMLHGMGIVTDVNLAAVAEASHAVADRLGRPLPSRYLRGGARARREARPVSERPASILVVDDLPANLELMTRRLERSGFDVITASEGSQALDLLRKQAVDLVLLDIMMPGMTGLDVLRHIRATWSAAVLPVIMVTAKTDSEDVVEALGLGANDYVTKPVDYPVALARMQSHLRTREATRAQMPTPDDEPRTPAQAVPGSVVGGRYRLESVIGGGSFGTVFRAHHLELDRPVAVKVLSTSAGTDPEALARFRREGSSACRVQHPNAVQVLDLGVNDGGVAYLVMELLRGHALDAVLDDAGRLTPRRGAEILEPVCRALAVAHAADVVHRDIKPSNIFLHGTEETPKILDFGIAKIAGAAALGQNLTTDGSLLGTPAYMAPERFRRGPYGPKSDIYSVGTVLYEMLAGRLPFIPASPDPLALVAMQVEDDPPPLRPQCPDVSPSLEALVRSTLDKEPDARPGAELLARRLARVATDPFTPLDDEAVG